MEIPVNQKFTLTIREAAEYYNIGIHKLRRLAEDNKDTFSVQNGNRFLIIRTKFEEYLINSSTL